MYSSKRFGSWKFHGIKIIPSTENEMQNIIKSFKSKNLGMF